MPIKVIICLAFKLLYYRALGGIFLFFLKEQRLAYLKEFFFSPDASAGRSVLLPQKVLGSYEVGRVCLVQHLIRKELLKI